MKLIDLLVQELPKRGGWPDGIVKIHQDYDGETWAWLNHDSAERLFTLDQVATNARKFCKNEKCENMVTRAQYEAALQQSIWDGTNLPPVGCDVEYHCYPDGWVTINIVARIKGATFIEWKSGTHKGGDIIRGDFPLERVRPLRTEAERAIDEMVRLSGVSIGAAKILYDAGYRK